MLSESHMPERLRSIVGVDRILSGQHDSGHKKQLTDPAEEVGQSELHQILSNERRRRLIREIVENEDKELTVSELSERLAAQESGTEPAPRKVRHSVYVTLRQNHVPKLDDHDVVDFDGESKCIEPNERTPVFYRLIDEADGTEWPSERHVLLALLVGTVLGLVGILDALPLGLFTESQIAGAFVLWQLGLVIVLKRYSS